MSKEAKAHVLDNISLMCQKHGHLSENGAIITTSGALLMQLRYICRNISILEESAQVYYTFHLRLSLFKFMSLCWVRRFWCSNFHECHCVTLIIRKHFFPIAFIIIWYICFLYIYIYIYIFFLSLKVLFIAQRSIL